MRLIIRMMAPRLMIMLLFFMLVMLFMVIAW